MPDAQRARHHRLRAFALRSTRVERADWLSPNIRRVTLSGDAIAHLVPERACQQLSVEGGAPWPLGGRVYSICNVDLRAQTLDLIADVHGEGPGSERFAKAQVGESWRVWGPGGGLRINSTLSTRVLIGDASALGTLRSLYEARRRKDTLFGFFEYAREGDEVAVDALDLPLTPVWRAGMRSDALSAHVLQTLRDLRRRDVSAEWILVGRLQTIQLVRQTLHEAGVDNRNIRMKNHWSAHR